MIPTKGITHFITDTQSTTERVEEKEQTDKHGLGSAPSARKGVCDTVHSLCICRLSPACILCETSTKSTNNALVNPASVGQQVLAVAFLTFVDSLLCPTSIFSCLLQLTVSYPEQLSQADWSLLPSVLNCSLCLFSDLPSLVHFRSRGKSRPQSFVWVSRQNRQRDRLSGANTNENELLRIVSQAIDYDFLEM